MKKFRLFYLFCAVSTAFISCSSDEPVYHYIDEPAIVALKGSDTVLHVADGILHVPGQLKDVSPGDCLIAYFTVDLGKQPVANQTQAQNLNYEKIGKSSIRTISGQMQSEFNDSITLASMYSRAFDSTLFFIFEHKGGAYEYEIICNRDSIETRINGMDVPKLYLRAKKTGTSDSNRKKTRFAFDMAEFVKNYATPNDKEVNLFLQYKTGTKQNKDVYKKFINYPLRWRP